jgi:YidC/Oxa1 family membrane protein insertase
LNQQGRQVLFIVLSIVILGLWMYFMPAPPSPPNNPSSAEPPNQSAGTMTSLASSPETKISAAVGKKVAPQRVVANIPVSQVTIETDDYIATFSNQGAVLTSYELKKYANRYTNKPIQLVNPDPNHPKPFAMDYDPIPQLNQKVFQVEGSSKKLSKSDNKAKVQFRYVDEKGTVLKKTFDFTNGSFMIGFDVTVNQTGRDFIPSSNLILEWSDSLGKEEITGTNARVAAGCRIVTLAGDQLDKEQSKKSQDSWNSPPSINWTAVANQYFMAALIPDTSTGGASVRVLRDYNVFKTPTEDDPNPGIDPNIFTPRPLLTFTGKDLRTGENFERKGKVYFGPQDYTLLKSLNLGLEKVIDFGVFGSISVYMLALLKWFYTWSHNWGLAIILLSIAVKLLLWFPTHSSYKNMYMMQQKTRELQPKLDAIKRKYVDDKQKQQQETMALYNQAGINPLGGCLPMLLQLPIFYALYATLGHSIELYQAPFLWLGDLTLMDKWHVFPLLMGLTMIVQQKVSGQMATQAAGQQKFMMWFFPIFLTFLSFKWPSGLLVYWVVTNLLSMLQQKIVNLEIQKTKKKEEVVKS